jgi:cytochrome c556
MNLACRAIALSAALFAGSYAAYSAYAASPAATAAVNARKANYKEIGGAFKTINDEVKSGAPDMNSVRPLARDLAGRAALQLRNFPRGSGPESGLKTRAKPEIWSDNATFVKLQNDMVSAANALNAAAAKGDVAGLTAARTTLGGICKSCHDRFRTPE